MLFSLFP
jgi:hypothetical protein